MNGRRPLKPTTDHTDACEGLHFCLAWRSRRAWLTFDVWANEEMKLDARSAPQAKKDEFIDWLARETTSLLQRAAGSEEMLKAAAFLFMNRVREARLAESDVALALGQSVARSSISERDEARLYDWIECFDQIVTGAYAESRKVRRWWRFWT